MLFLKIFSLNDASVMRSSRSQVNATEKFILAECLEAEWLVAECNKIIHATWEITKS